MSSPAGGRGRGGVLVDRPARRARPPARRQPGLHRRGRRRRPRRAAPACGRRGRPAHPRARTPGRRRRRSSPAPVDDGVLVLEQHSDCTSLPGSAEEDRAPASNSSPGYGVGPGSVAFPSEAIRQAPFTRRSSIVSSDGVWPSALVRTWALAVSPLTVILPTDSFGALTRPRPCSSACSHPSPTSLQPLDQDRRERARTSPCSRAPPSRGRSPPARRAPARSSDGVPFHRTPAPPARAPRGPRRASPAVPDQVAHRAENRMAAIWKAQPRPWGPGSAATAAGRRSSRSRSTTRASIASTR